MSDTPTHSPEHSPEQQATQHWRAQHPAAWIRLSYYIAWGCGRLSAVFFVLIAAVITFEVVARYVFHAPTIWSEDISLMCQIWATCLGANWVLQHNALIRIDLLTRHLKGIKSQIADCLSLSVVVFFSGYISYYGFELTREAISMGSASATMLGLPLWMTKSAIPVGFGLLTIQAITEIVLVLSGHQQAQEEVMI